MGVNGPGDIRPLWGGKASRMRATPRAKAKAPNEASYLRRRRLFMGVQGGIAMQQTPPGSGPWEHGPPSEAARVHFHVLSNLAGRHWNDA